MIAFIPWGSLSDIEKRKSEHLEIVLKRDVSAHGKTSGFDRIDFEHVALPELDLDSISLETEFLGRRLKAPLLVSSMTGGPEKAASINAAIAEAAEAAGVAFGVGSQRVALEGNAAGGFDASLRRLAPNVPILANFGAAQLKQWQGVEMARRAIDMIEADALIIHLNPLQEAVQPDGDRDWSGLLSKIGEIARALPGRVIVKEVGAGISGALASRLWNEGVILIDVAGAGGTSWAAVEAERASTAREREVALAFRDWGIPTAEALIDVRRACPSAVVIASGGIRTGIDAAKAIRLGADLAGLAAGVLQAALEGADALTAHIETLIAQLRITCFCTGSADLAALKTAKLR